MSKINSLQALRGLAVVGIVLFHMVFVEQKNPGGDVLLPSFLQFNQIFVDLFFVISGFVMVLVSRGRFQRPQEVKRFIFNRLARIYPLYWMYFFITLGVFFVMPQWVNSTHGQPDILGAFFLLPSERVSLVMVAWTLTFEVWFYLVFSVFLFFKEKCLPYTLLIWALLLIGVNSVFDIQSFSPLFKIAFHPYGLEFIVGGLMSLLFVSDFKRRISTVSVCIFLFFVLLLGLPLSYYARFFYGDGLPRMMCVGGVFGLVVFILALLERRNVFKVAKIFRMIGDSSYSTYLSHVLVLGVFGKIWAAFGGVSGSYFDNLLFIVMMLLATLIYGWLAYVFLERPMMIISNRLCDRLFFTASSAGSAVKST